MRRTTIEPTIASNHVWSEKNSSSGALKKTLPGQPPRQGADDAQDHRGQPAAALFAREDRLGDGAGDQAQE